MEIRIYQVRDGEEPVSSDLVLVDMPVVPRTGESITLKNGTWDIFHVKYFIDPLWICVYTKLHYPQITDYPGQRHLKAVSSARRSTPAPADSSQPAGEREDPSG